MGTLLAVMIRRTGVRSRRPMRHARNGILETARLVRWSRLAFRAFPPPPPRRPSWKMSVAAAFGFVASRIVMLGQENFSDVLPARFLIVEGAFDRLALFLRQFDIADHYTASSLASNPVVMDCGFQSPVPYPSHDSNCITAGMILRCAGAEAPIQAFVRRRCARPQACNLSVSAWPCCE